MDAAKPTFDTPVRINPYLNPFKLTHIAWNCLRYNILPPHRIGPRPPRTLVIYVTHRCDSRCFICQLWQTRTDTEKSLELGIEEIERLVRDPVISKVEHLNINGGEPTLRDDLVDIVRMACRSMPRLKHITMSSNGLAPDRVVPKVMAISKICRDHGIRFSLGLSIHGIDGILEKVFRVKHAFELVTETVSRLKPDLSRNKHSLSLNCVLTDVNVEAAEKLLVWSKEMKIPANFVLGEVRNRFVNHKYREKIRIKGGKHKYMMSFFERLAADKRLNNPSAYRYHHLLKMLKTEKPRTMACHYALGGLVLGAHGELFYCPHSREIGNIRQSNPRDIIFGDGNREYFQTKLIQSACHRCPPYTFNRYEFEKDLMKYMAFLVQGRPKKSMRPY